MAKRHNKNRPNASGRSSVTERFSMLPHKIVESAAYRALSLAARCLLSDILTMCDDKNNGLIWLSVKDAQALLAVGSNRTIANAFNELQDVGLLRMTCDSEFRTKASVDGSARARCWRLTFRHGMGRGPTNEWQSYQPQGQTEANRRADTGLRALAKRRKSAAQKQKPGALSAHLTPETPIIAPKPGALSAPANSTIDENQPKLSDALSAPHIYKPRGLGDSVASIAWWQPDQSRTLANLTYLHLLAFEARQPERLAA